MRLTFPLAVLSSCFTRPPPGLGCPFFWVCLPSFRFFFAPVVSCFLWLPAPVVLDLCSFCLFPPPPLVYFFSFRPSCFLVFAAACLVRCVFALAPFSSSPPPSPCFFFCPPSLVFVFFFLSVSSLLVLLGVCFLLPVLFRTPPFFFIRCCLFVALFVSSHPPFPSPPPSSPLSPLFFAVRRLFVFVACRLPAPLPPPSFFFWLPGLSLLVFTTIALLAGMTATSLNNGVHTRPQLRQGQTGVKILTEEVH